MISATLDTQRLYQGAEFRRAGNPNPAKPEPNRWSYDAGVGVELLTERHAGQIAGVLGCWDRMLVFGTLPKICFAGE